MILNSMIEGSFSSFTAVLQSLLIANQVVLVQLLGFTVGTMVGFILGTRDSFEPSSSLKIEPSFGAKRRKKPPEKFIHRVGFRNSIVLLASSIFGSALASKQIHSDIDFQMRRPKVEIESF